jgi:Ran GTPase-activating protein (RanGAP) involved in mRNA processing and transport
MTGWCRISTLELPECDMEGQDAESLTEVLAQCLALTHLDLKKDMIGAGWTESFARGLAQCTSLAHLDLSCNGIGSGGAEGLARVLGQCAAMVHLELTYNDIGAAGAESLECWDSAQRWLTSVFAAMRSAQAG